MSTKNLFRRALSVVVVAAAMLAPVGLSTASAQDHHPVRTEIVRTVRNVERAPARIQRNVARTQNRVVRAVARRELAVHRAIVRRERSLMSH